MLNAFAGSSSGSRPPRHTRRGARSRPVVGPPGGTAERRHHSFVRALNVTAPRGAQRERASPNTDPLSHKVATTHCGEKRCTMLSPVRALHQGQSPSWPRNTVAAIAPHKLSIIARSILRSPIRHADCPRAHCRCAWEPTPVPGVGVSLGEFASLGAPHDQWRIHKGKSVSSSVSPMRSSRSFRATGPGGRLSGALENGAVCAHHGDPGAHRDTGAQGTVSV